MPGKQKVLFLIESLSAGGAERVLLTILKHLDNTRFEVTLCSIVDKWQYKNDIPHNISYLALLPDASSLSGLRLLIYKLKYKLLYSFLSPRWAYRMFVPKNSDVEVAFVEGEVTKILSGSTNAIALKLAWVHIDLEKYPWTQASGVYKNKHEEAKVYSCFDKIVGVSDSVCRAFKSRFDVEAVTAYNPVDSCQIISLAKEKVGVPAKSSFRIISLGRLAPQKAFDRLLRVASKLKEEGEEFELWILGEGGCRSMLEKLIDDTHLSGTVTLWGFKSNPYPYVVASDLFVCSSLAEGYSTAASEALILGVPVLTTRCAGMEELIGPSGGGVVVDNNEDALYEGLKKIMRESTYYQRLKTSAVARRTDFRLDVAMSHIESLLSGC